MKKVKIIPPLDFIQERKLAEKLKPRMNARKRKQVDKVFKTPQLKSHPRIHYVQRQHTTKLKKTKSYPAKHYPTFKS